MFEIHSPSPVNHSQLSFLSENSSNPSHYIKRERSPRPTRPNPYPQGSGSKTHLTLPTIPISEPMRQISYRDKSSSLIPSRPIPKRSHSFCGDASTTTYALASTPSRYLSEDKNNIIAPPLERTLTSLGRPKGDYRRPNFSPQNKTCTMMESGFNSSSYNHVPNYNLSSFNNPNLNPNPIAGGRSRGEMLAPSLQRTVSSIGTEGNKSSEDMQMVRPRPRSSKTCPLVQRGRIEDVPELNLDFDLHPVSFMDVLDLGFSSMDNDVNVREEGNESREGLERRESVQMRGGRSGNWLMVESEDVSMIARRANRTIVDYEDDTINDMEENQHITSSTSLPIITVTQDHSPTQHDQHLRPMFHPPFHHSLPPHHHEPHQQHGGFSSSRPSINPYQPQPQTHTPTYNAHTSTIQFPHILSKPNQHPSYPIQYQIGLPTQYQIGLPTQYQAGFPTQYHIGLPTQDPYPTLDPTQHPQTDIDKITSIQPTQNKSYHGVENRHSNYGFHERFPLKESNQSNRVFLGISPTPGLESDHGSRSSSYVMTPLNHVSLSGDRYESDDVGKVIEEGVGGLELV
ncbi:hypothetical protein M231_00994 [Tremella mesenterica]|uniref:Uncharacterized protein n=1 Tax=Tremella mesenterica TaxID=5217 RepID=A0A4Q1BUH1_TREME|nr:hypothetical protein M231_00994 [Tremella mesenterica]